MLEIVLVLVLSAATVIVDVGVKSAGFVPGEPLRSGVVLRAGVGLPFAPRN